jgi:hypothetical protein
VVTMIDGDHCVLVLDIQTKILVALFLGKYNREQIYGKSIGWIKG